MKKLLLAFLLCAPLWAATTYYVASTGNDSTGNGTSGNPWLSLSKGINSMGCGDTLIVVANGSYIPAGSTTAPYIANCASTRTIQSSKWNLFAPAGFRTNPTNDAANYGKIQIQSSDTNAFSATTEAHGSNLVSGGGYGCKISGIAGGSTISSSCSLGSGSQGMPNLANGTQLEFDIAQFGPGTQTMPTNITFQQKYYVINCTSCGSGNPAQTFQISATQGGSAITGIVCSGTCLLGDYTDIYGEGGSTIVNMPLQVSTATSVFTADDYTLSSGWVNGLDVSLSAVNWAFFGTLPAPLQLDTHYYVCNLSGQTFKLCTDAAGTSPVTITNVGTGGLSISGNNVSGYWAFRGLEITVQSGIGGAYGLISFGTGQSAVLSSAHHLEIDHCYIHQVAQDPTPSSKGVADNARFLWIHDSWVSGFTLSETNAVGGQGAIGPTTIQNTFLEASGEDTIYGGGGSGSGTANLYHSFINNYFFNAPVQKITWNCPTGASSGPCTNTPGGAGYTGTSFPPSGYCWYDNYDAALPGGEWYYDAPTTQWYQCQSNHTWATTASTPYFGGCVNGHSEPTYCGSPFWKDVTEIKNGAYFTWTGNLLQYMWALGQDGEAFNLSSESNGYEPAMRDDHITVTNNAIFNTYEFAVRVPFCATGSTAYNGCGAPTGFHTYTNNLMVIDPRACGVTSGSTILIGCPAAGNFSPKMMGNGAVSGLNTSAELVANNTWWRPDTGLQTGLTSSIYYGGSADCVNFGVGYNVVNQNNIFTADYWGDCVNTTYVLRLYFQNSTFTHNVQNFGNSSGYTDNGTNTFTNIAFPASHNTTINYVNGTGQPDGDYHLVAGGGGSPYNATNCSPCSTDGTDLGADIDMVNMLTANVRAGTPPMDQQAHLFYDIGSTSLVIRYTAPTSAACTATLYNAPARIAGNVVTTVADSAATSVQNGLDRNLLITGLSASTVYYPKLVCGGGVTMIGTGNGVVSFTTKASGSGTTNFPFLWSSATAMQYGSSLSGGTIVSPTVLSAATTQPIPVTHGTPEYAQVGTTGPIIILINP